MIETQEMLKLLFGVTVVEDRCTTCGKLSYHHLLGFHVDGPDG